MSASCTQLLVTDGPLPEKWIHGARGEPRLQAHRLDVDDVTAAAGGGLGSAWVIRFSKWIAGEHAGGPRWDEFEPAYEGNFVFFFVGAERAILFDTGPIPYPPLCAALQQLASERASELELVVSHTHGHGDHVMGDGLAWADGPWRSVTFVPAEQLSVAEYYGLPPPSTMPDPSQCQVEYDLGGRSLTLFWILGHHDSHIAIYDRATNVLITGDNLYAGRLYVSEPALFVSSCQRLAEFASALPAGLRVLGCHIEMDSTGAEYTTGTVYQPDEAEYALGQSDVVALAQCARDAAVRDADGTVVALPRMVTGRFIIDPKGPALYVAPATVGATALTIAGAEGAAKV